MMNFEHLVWRKIGYSAVTVFLIILYIFESADMIRKNEMGMDYLAYWSVGKAADIYGYSNIYDAQQLYKIQLEAWESLGHRIDDFEYWPAAYLAVFLVPFQFLSRLDLLPSHWFWVISNWLVLIFYLIFFSQQMVPKTSKKLPLTLLTFSILLFYPTFFNFVWGQVGVLLVVCFGEFIRNSLIKKPLISGFWLGVLLIKPPILIVIVPALLIMRHFRMLMGFFVTGLGLSLISLMLTGFTGFTTLLRTWINFVPDGEIIVSGSMMNWRMLGFRLQEYLPATTGFIVVVLGSLVTLILCWAIIKLRPEPGSDQWVMVMLGLTAATCAVSWHSNIHMAMVLIPFFVFGFARKCLSLYVVDAWVLAPPLMLALIMLIMSITTHGVGPYFLRHGNYLLTYLFLFLNLIVCIYVLKDARTKKLMP